MKYRSICLVVFVSFAAISIRVRADEPVTRTIVIGSKAFTESRLLGEILAQWIERSSDLAVERRLNLGGTLIAFAALESGEIDLYAEYTGTAWAVQLAETSPARDPLHTYIEVQQRFRSAYDIEWAPPFGFENGYALMMREAQADALGIRRLSDLASHPELRIVVSHEFLAREDGYPGLQEHYVFPFEPRGMEHALAYEALGADRADVVDTYTTDGRLLRLGGRLLEDDRAFFPPYDCAPIVRGETWRAYPALRNALEELAYKIDNDAMRRLNATVENGDGNIAGVASRFVAELMENTRSSDSNLESISTLSDGGALIPWKRVGEHLWLSALSVALAILFGFPLGVWMTSYPRTAGVVLTIAGVIQTIPSLALLALLIPVPGLGIGTTSAIVALFLYALLPILRNVYTGIQGVDPLLIEAAEGLGLEPVEILRRIQLPLAAPTIFGGVRIAAVISIGVATLGAFIGAGGLGEPILTGLQLGKISLVLQGAEPAAVLALVVDGVLGRIEKRYTRI